MIFRGSFQLRFLKDLCLVAIPGELFKWLRKNAGKEGRGEELEKMIKHC